MLEVLILVLLGVWFLWAIRSCLHRKGSGCGGCNGCCENCHQNCHS